MKQVTTYLILRNFNNIFSGEITAIDTKEKQSNLMNTTLEFNIKSKTRSKEDKYKKEILIKV